MVKALIAFRIICGLGRDAQFDCGTRILRVIHGRDARATRILSRRPEVVSEKAAPALLVGPMSRLGLDNLRCGTVILDSSGVYLLAARPVPGFAN